MHKINVTPGRRVTLVMPASEVCCFMRVYGQPFELEILPSGYVQLYKDDREFSIPITTGEAGIYGSRSTGYYAYIEHGLMYTHLGVKAHFPDCTPRQLELFHLGCATFGFVLNCPEHRQKWVSWFAFAQLITQYSDSPQAKEIAAAMSA